MARGKRRGPLQAHLVFSTLEESDASPTIGNASKHVVDDDGPRPEDQQVFAEPVPLGKFAETHTWIKGI
eukprot:5591394-Prorocentrum_lima.AAC.1